MFTCTLITDRYRNEKLISSDENEINEKNYDNIVNASSFFRGLGGKEIYKSANTSIGKKVVKITSISPDGTMKTIRRFKNFKWDKVD